MARPYIASLHSVSTLSLTWAWEVLRACPNAEERCHFRRDDVELEVAFADCGDWEPRRWVA